LSRQRLTLAIASPVLVLASVMVIAALAFLYTGGAGPATTQTGLARAGEVLTLVIVTDEGGAVARDFVFDWFLVAPALLLIPAVALAWLIAGRVLGYIDRATSSVEIADEERHSRLQEVVHELRTNDCRTGGGSGSRAHRDRELPEQRGAPGAGWVDCDSRLG
jgi:hypothetical protein